MKATEIRKKIHRLMAENNTDMVSLPARTAILLGIEYVTLKGKVNIEGINFEEEYVPINNDDIVIIYDVMRKLFNDIHLYELSESDVNKLVKEINFGSIYIADYENSFGVSANEVANYVEGYLEDKEEYNSFYEYIQSNEF